MTDWTTEERGLRECLEQGQAIVVTMRARHTRLVAWARRTGCFVRIDRRSSWGNPHRIGRDGGRDAVIARYRNDIETSDLTARVGELRGRALGCWCAPAACHGNGLAELANAKRV